MKKVNSKADEARRMALLDMKKEFRKEGKRVIKANKETFKTYGYE